MAGVTQKVVFSTNPPSPGGVAGELAKTETQSGEDERAVTYMSYSAGDGEFAAALADLGVSAQPRSPWFGVAAAGKAPEWTRAGEGLLRLAAAPQRALEFGLNQAGRRDWARAWLLSDGQDYALLIQSEGQGRLRQAAGREPGLLEIARELSLVLDEQPCPPHSLSLPAYAALLASADSLQSGFLRARLARKPAARPVLVAEFLEEELEAGLTGQDTNWSVSAAAGLHPQWLQGCKGQLLDGLRELKEAGLVMPVVRGMALTEEGERLALPLTCLQSTLHVSNGTQAATLFQGEGFAWLAEINGNVKIQAAGHWSDLLERFSSQPAEESPQCPKCHGQVRSGAAFCTHCGQGLAAACPNCGKKVQPGDRFCGGCGEKIR